MAQLPPPGILTDLDNYRPWKLQMQEYLEDEELIGGVKGFAPDCVLSTTQKNVVRNKAYREIMVRLGPEVARDVGEMNSAKALWKKLATLGKNHALMREVEEEKGKDFLVRAFAQDLKNLEAKIMHAQNEVDRYTTELEGLRNDHVQLTSKIARCQMERLTDLVFDGNIREEPIRELGRNINQMVAIALPDLKVAIMHQVYHAYQRMKNEFIDPATNVNVNWQVVEGHLGIDIGSWAPPPPHQPEGEAADHQPEHNP